MDGVEIFELKDINFDDDFQDDKLNLEIPSFLRRK